MIQVLLIFGMLFIEMLGALAIIASIAGIVGHFLLFMCITTQPGIGTTRALAHHSGSVVEEKRDVMLVAISWINCIAARQASLPLASKLSRPFLLSTT